MVAELLLSALLIAGLVLLASGSSGSGDVAGFRRLCVNFTEEVDPTLALFFGTHTILFPITFGYKRDANGTPKIMLHHSSMPYSGAEPAAPVSTETVVTNYLSIKL